MSSTLVFRVLYPFSNMCTKSIKGSCTCISYDFKAFSWIKQFHELSQRALVLFSARHAQNNVNIVGILAMSFSLFREEIINSNKHTCSIFTIQAKFKPSKLHRYPLVVAAILTLQWNTTRFFYFL